MGDMTLKEMNEQSYYDQAEVIWEMMRRVDKLWEAWENGDFDNGPEFAWHGDEKHLTIADNATLVAQSDRLLHENGELSKENALLRARGNTLVEMSRALYVKNESLQTKIGNLEDEMRDRGWR